MKVLVVLHTFLIRLRIWKQVSDSLIVNFGVTDPYCDCLVKLCTSKSINLVDSTGQNSSVFEYGSAASHSVSFTCTCLAIAENRAVIAINDRVYDLRGS